MPSVPPPPSARARSGPEPDRPGWRLWLAPAAVVLGLGLGQVGIVIVNIIGQAAGGSTLRHPSPAVSIISDVVLDAAFVFAAVYLAGLGGRVRAADLGFRRLPWRGGIAAALLAGIAYYVLTAAYAALFNLHGKDKLPSELGVSRSTAALVGAAAFVCVIAPIAEELFFRGFLFSVLRGWRITVAGRDLGPWLAALVVGILFGLAHTGSAASQYLVPLGFLGFVLCMVRWRTGSLYPCMALHSFNNSLALGVNQLNWSPLGIMILIAASLGVIALITGPLSSGRERPAARREPAPVG